MSAVIPPAGKRARTLAPWLLALVLVLPAFAPLLAHYVGFASAGLEPTGFIMYDTPYYLANAREIIDGRSALGVYSNAFSFDYSSPKIYFQPLTLVLGTLMRVPGLDPGILFALIGLVAAVVCGRVAIALFDRFSTAVGAPRTLAILAFFWGGGIVVITATFFAFLPSGSAGAEHGFDLAAWWWFWKTGDPVGGWWLLNFGRNLVLPTEAVYHALFFGTIVLITARRFALAACTMASLSISHPFTGIQIIAIIGAWAFLEVVLLRSRSVPLWFLVTTALIGAWHVAYYLVFLPSFPEHRQLQEQWTLDWGISGIQTVIAYGLVLAFAAWRMRSAEKIRDVAAHWPNRLLLVWLLVCLLLENHDLFLAEPIQPLHFGRGYSWVALFMLGLPSIVAAFERAVRQRPAAKVAALTAALILLFVVDNAVWITATSARAVGAQLGRGLPADSLHLGYGLSEDEARLYEWLNDRPSEGRIVLTEDERVGYLATVYTPLRSWRSHYANTPWSAQRREELRQLFDSGAVVEEWRLRPTLIVLRDSTGWRGRLRNFGSDTMELTFHNPSYTVISITPPTDTAHRIAGSTVGRAVP